MTKNSNEDNIYNKVEKLAVSGVDLVNNAVNFISSVSQSKDHLLKQEMLEKLSSSNRVSIHEQLVNVVEGLLKEGVDPHTINRSTSKSAFDLAAENQNTAFIKIMHDYFPTAKTAEAMQVIAANNKDISYTYPDVDKTRKEYLDNPMHEKATARSSSPKAVSNDIYEETTGPQAGPRKTKVNVASRYNPNDKGAHSH